MTFIQLRFTHSKFKCSAPKLIHLLKLVASYCSSTQYMYCLEHLDKFGKETHPHFHMNLYTERDIKKDTLQKAIKRLFLSRDLEIKGNSMYSVRIIGDPDDEHRWWRYICKEEGALIGATPSFNKDLMEQYSLLARDERKSQQKRNNLTLDKYLDKSSFKGKMYIDFTKKEIKTKNIFFINLIKHYQKKAKVPPFTKLDDYWTDYQINTGLMTAEEYVNKMYSNYYENDVP